MRLNTVSHTVRRGQGRRVSRRRAVWNELNLFAVSMTTRACRSAGDVGPGARSATQSDWYAAVAVGNDADGHDVLQYHAGHREELASRVLRPFLVAHVQRASIVGRRVRKFRNLHVYAAHCN